MSIQEIYDGLLMGIENMSWIEGLAVFFSLASVLFARVNKIWVYPTGIAGILLSIYIFSLEENRLYPDAALNLYYLVMSIYGWYFWTHGKEEEEVPITHANKKETVTAIGLFLVLWAGLYWWLSTYQINEVPLMDSFCSSLAATGMWLLAKRKIENWLALLVADFVSIGMFFIKGLLLFSVLNILYVIIAVLGYWSWKKIIKSQEILRIKE